MLRMAILRGNMNRIMFTVFTLLLETEYLGYTLNKRGLAQSKVKVGCKRHRGDSFGMQVKLV